MLSFSVLKKWSEKLLLVAKRCTDQPKIIRSLLYTDSLHSPRWNNSRKSDFIELTNHTTHEVYDFLEGITNEQTIHSDCGGDREADDRYSSTYFEEEPQKD